jgi:hypothetical protein
MPWPHDADGDVFRRLESQNFDFSKSWTIDFNIDFASWPPAQEALKKIRTSFSAVAVHEPDDEDPGYVLVQVVDHLTYDLVIRMQRELTELASEYGGVCESWGLLH